MGVIRLSAPLQRDSIVDGNGLRSVVWTQGCGHNCDECHNPQTHNFNGGFEKDIDELVEEIVSNKMQSGVTLSGGDPMFQPEATLELVQKLKQHNINIWCYTGFTYKQIWLNPKQRAILYYIDVLVDGKFDKNLKSYEVKFRGSKNQRLIDVNKSLKQNKVIELNEA
jgi:anaerobic ribonucleoside-triphosphate reductase activating protein